MKVSVILNDMDRTAYAVYGYLSWLLQDTNESFEIIMLLFNDKEEYFKTFFENKNKSCSVVIKTFKAPLFFNISAANNLGLHFAKGKYVFFVNSDIIYPSNFLRLVLNELEKRGLLYLTGSRINLSEGQTKALKSPDDYSLNNNFDFLKGYEDLRETGTKWHTVSPWMVRKDIIDKIGGFDPDILCHEDRDFHDRIIHYLVRNELQLCQFILTDLYGYHLHHPPGELYNVSTESLALINERRKLLADKNSDSDILSTKIDDLDSILNALYSTPMPAYFTNIKAHGPNVNQRGEKYGKNKYFRRLFLAAKILIKGKV